MTIARASHEHLEPLVVLFDAYRRFYQMPSDPAGAGTFLNERLLKNDSVIFVAVDERGDLHGFAQLYPSFSSVSMQRLWILNDLFVVESARNTGVATVLMDRCKQLAIETKSKGLVLETSRDNEPAQHLYVKLGWKKDDQFDKYFLETH